VFVSTSSSSSSSSLADGIVWDDETTFTTLSSPSCHDPKAIWCDEFETPGPPNSTIWKYDLGNNNGWGNAEVQEYTTNNVYVGDDGYLHIQVTVNDDDRKFKYQSSRIHTQGTVTFQYVTLEASIKIPDLTGGLWPAFWMLGTSYPKEKPWPACGEIDIAEWGPKLAVESDTLHTQVLAAVHYEFMDMPRNEYSTFQILDPQQQGQQQQQEQAFHQDFHTYRLDWTPKFVRMFVDDRLVFAKDLSKCEDVGEDCTELHDPQFLIFNVAVGGTFTGVDTPTSSGGELLVDWVRAYEVDDIYLDPLDNTGNNDTAKVGSGVVVTPCDGPCPIIEANNDELASGTTTFMTTCTFWMLSMLCIAAVTLK